MIRYKSAVAFHWLFLLGMVISANRLAAGPAAGPLQPAAPLIHLNAADAGAGHRFWANQGSPGQFTRIGHPRIVKIQGAPAVEFSHGDGYRGPLPPRSLCGSAPRSIAVWVYKPAVKSAAGTLVSWGRRGGPAGTEMSFGWGASPQYGAATHWADDMGWPSPPAVGQWHFLVYAYDGKTARVYDNGLLRASLRIHLDTHRLGPIEIGAQNNAANQPDFAYPDLVSGQMAIGDVRIYNCALTAAQIQAAFLRRQAFYHAHIVRTQARMLLGHIQTFVLPNLTLRISKATGEAISLRTRGGKGRHGFEFLLWKKRFLRAHNGYFLLGDVTLQARATGAHGWHFFSTAGRRRPSAAVHVAAHGLLSAADITPSLGRGSPVSIIREWRRTPGGNLAMSFIVRNRTARPVTIGSFGAAMIFNSDFDGLQRSVMYRHCTYVNPYIGGDAGYLKVTRFNGRLPELFVLPGPHTGFEAYQPLSQDRDAAWPTLGAMQEWLVHSLACCRTSWKNAHPWNRGTDLHLPPGGSRTFTWRFVPALGKTPDHAVMARHHVPAAMGVPGFVVATNSPAKLFLRAPANIASISVFPRQALRATPAENPVRPPWLAYDVQGIKPGRARLTIRYANGTTQFIQYFVILPQRRLLRRFGHFLATHEWFADPHDPFHRTDSFMPWDNRTHKMVLQHAGSIWMVGLSDEMGAGPNLAAAMKNLYLPDRRQIQDLELYVRHALWGHLQQKNYGVRRSQFYYDPAKFPHYYTISDGGFMGPEAQAHAIWRAFNYPHQVAIYWCLYRLARYHPGLVVSRPWKWWLLQAFRTIMAQNTFAPNPDGMMDGDIYLAVLKDLRREGLHRQYARLLAFEKQRLKGWQATPYPYGSEMPWDSTGEPEVYLASRYFRASALASQTVRCILAFDPCVANWGYDGAGYRYFDEAVNGTQWPGIARLLQHYGGGINANALLAAFRSNPADVSALHTGYAGTVGALADIAPDGFGSQCFDGDPAIMKFDPYVGDYGLEFYGFVRADGAYVVHSGNFGWLGYGCGVRQLKNAVAITMHDGLHHRLYIAPLHLFVKCFAGHISHALFHPARGSLTLYLAPASRMTTQAFLRIKTPGRNQAVKFRVIFPAGARQWHGLTVIPLAAGQTRVVISPSAK